MKILWNLAQVRFALAMILGMSAFGAASFTATDAQANVGRLRAIEKVVGLHERKNNKTIRRLVGVNPARTPWCGAAVAYAVRKAGGKPVKGHLGAKNWSRFGKGVKLSSARKGDIVVLRNKRGYHVAVFKKHAGKGRIIACGGNMSNRFKCSKYRTSGVRAVRR